MARPKNKKRKMGCCELSWSVKYVGKKLSNKEIRDLILNEVYVKSLQPIDIGTFSNTEYYVALKKVATGDIFASVIYVRCQRNGEFWYEGFDEEMGIPTHNCPKRILEKLTPIDSICANNWRKRCWERFDKPKPTIGDTIRFETIIKFNDGAELDTFRIIKHRKKVLFETHDGLLYRIPRWKEREFSIIKSKGV